MLKTRQPALFLGHGAPTNATQDNEFTRSLRALGRRLVRPRAVLIVSAHWVTEGVQVTGAERPKTIHDFYGFPPELYAIEYAAPGAPALALEVGSLLSGELTVDSARGLDHGAWSVLCFLFPEADVPVIQLSIDLGRSAEQHRQLGRSLSPLRDAGVLLIGSGNLTHNLGAVSFPDEHAAPPEWVRVFDEWAKEALLRGDEEALVAMRAPADLFSRNHPTAEHYIPLLYALGARAPADPVSFPFEGYQYGVLSMRCVQFG